MSRPVLDLTSFHFRRELGDVTLFGTWIGEDIDESEPCLVLVPTHRKATVGRTRPCCIALSSAYKYDEPGYLLARAVEFNKELGFTDDMKHVYKMADIIHGHLQDLIEMPPRPVLGATDAAEVTVTHESGRQMTAVIRDYH